MLLVKDCRRLFREYQVKNLKFEVLRFGLLYGDRVDTNNGIQRILNTMVYKRKQFTEAKEKS